MTIDVAVGVIINADKKVLVALRNTAADQGGLWEFPGGKLEPQESAFAALCRELKEEVGIEVVQAKPLFSLQHDYPDYKVVLHNWLVTDFAGEARPCEGQPLRWLPITELKSLAFPAANKPLLDYLQNSTVII